MHRAAAASSTVPGLFAPQPIADRKCIDGGVSGSAAHRTSPWARRARSSSSCGIPASSASPPTSRAASGVRSMRCRATGTAVEVRTSRLAAGDINLMDPHQIEPALALGAQQSVEDAGALVAFFGP